MRYAAITPRPRSSPKVVVLMVLGAVSRKANNLSSLARAMHFNRTRSLLPSGLMNAQEIEGVL